MPELPEVESLRRSLEPLVLGRRVARVQIRRADVITGDATPQGLLEGARLTATRRHGKQLGLIAETGIGGAARALVIHLGMSGQVLHEPAEIDPHTHAVWHLDDGSQIRFRDPRRFGGLWTVADAATLDATLWRELGPDALRIDAADLVERAKGSRRAVKAVLLDQAVVAGIGNIYADESLFLAGIRPRRSACRVTRNEWAALAGTIRQVLTEAVGRGGSSLRDYVDARGHTGSAQAGHRVYGRADEPCVRCQTPLIQCSVAQRTTVFCRVCQQ